MSFKDEKQLTTSLSLMLVVAHCCLCLLLLCVQSHEFMQNINSLLHTLVQINLVCTLNGFVELCDCCLFTLTCVKSDLALRNSSPKPNVSFFDFKKLLPQLFSFRNVCIQIQLLIYINSSFQTHCRTVQTAHGVS